MKVVFVVLVVLLVMGAVIIVPTFFLRTRSNHPAAPHVSFMMSRDGGRSWFQPALSEDTQDLAEAEVLDVAFSRARGQQAIYLATRGKGIFVSNDSGFSWKHLEAEGVLKPTSEVFRIAVGSSPPHPVYVAAFQDGFGVVVKSESLRPLFFREIYRTSQSRFGVFDIHVDPSSESRVILATGEGGVLESRDGGVSWRILQWFPSSVIRLGLSSDNPALILALTLHQGLWRTESAGGDWAPVSIPALPSSRHKGYALAADPGRMGVFYLALRSNLYVSEDGGSTWEELEVLLSPDNTLPLGAVAVDPSNSLRIVVAVGSRIYASENSGSTWSLVGEGGEGTIGVIAFHPTNPRIVLAGVYR